MKPKVYGIRNCDTMKKAFAWRDAHGIAYEFHDYKKAGAPPGKLKAWAKQAGWEKLINMRGPTWRKIPEKERTGLNVAVHLSCSKPTPAPSSGRSSKRGASLLIGFDPEEYAANSKP